MVEIFHLEQCFFIVDGDNFFFIIVDLVMDDVIKVWEVSFNGDGIVGEVFFDDVDKVEHDFVGFKEVEIFDDFTNGTFSGFLVDEGVIIIEVFFEVFIDFNGAEDAVE